MNEDLIIKITMDTLKNISDLNDIFKNKNKFSCYLTMYLFMRLIREDLEKISINQLNIIEEKFIKNEKFYLLFKKMVTQNEKEN